MSTPADGSEKCINASQELKKIVTFYSGLSQGEIDEMELAGNLYCSKEINGVQTLCHAELLALKSIPHDILYDQGTSRGCQNFCKVMRRAGVLAKGCKTDDPEIYATYLKNTGKLDKVWKAAHKKLDIYALVDQVDEKPKSRYERYKEAGKITTGCLNAQPSELKELIRLNQIPRSILDQARNRPELCQVIDGFLRLNGVSDQVLSDYWRFGGELPVIDSKRLDTMKLFKDYDKVFNGTTSKKIVSTLKSIADKPLLVAGAGDKTAEEVRDSLDQIRKYVDDEDEEHEEAVS